MCILRHIVFEFISYASIVNNTSQQFNDDACNPITLTPPILVTTLVTCHKNRIH